MQGAESVVANGKEKRDQGSISHHSKVIAEKPKFFEKINFRGL